MFLGNWDLNGGFLNINLLDLFWGGLKDWGNLVLGDFVGCFKIDFFYIKMDKLYILFLGWGVLVIYIYLFGKMINVEGESDN